MLQPWLLTAKLFRGIAGKASKSSLGASRGIGSKACKSSLAAVAFQVLLETSVLGALVELPRRDASPAAAQLKKAKAARIIRRAKLAMSRTSHKETQRTTQI